MKNRITHIDIRITPEEKAKIKNKANTCGLSVSEYLRQLAFNYEPKPLPPIQFGELVKVLSDSYDLYLNRKDIDSANEIKHLVKLLIKAISPEKGGNSGLHEDMAGTG